MTKPLLFLCFGLLLGTLSPLKAEFISMETALALAKKEKLDLPAPQKDGSYQTLNKRGSAISDLNSITKEFMEYASEGKKRVIQLDATFGLITLKALKRGIHDFIATDTDMRHLAIIAKRFMEKPYLTDNKSLKLFHGSFPDSFKEFEDNSFDAVLLNRVIHFFTPTETTHTLKEVFRILKPGGRVFIVAITPYVKRFETFIPLYKQRLLLNRRYPGYVPNLKYFANPEVTTPKQMAQMHDKPFMFFDAQLMHRALSESGLIVEKAIEFPLTFKSSIWSLDGRELVGATARKPLQRTSFSPFMD
jgi:ubiquinone/menaquinone biosynthesis C-methylase UbiE